MCVCSRKPHAVFPVIRISSSFVVEKESSHIYSLSACSSSLLKLYNVNAEKKN